MRRRVGSLIYSVSEPALKTKRQVKSTWQIIEAQLIQAFDEFARRSAANGIDETFFAGEATKSLRVLDLMLRHYDCVVANPPYMGKRNMNKTLADFLDAAYPNAKSDLYTAFITRCAEFVQDGGRFGMITQQSFMFLSSFQDLRESLGCALLG